jgi:uncharacterized membrane protein
MRDGLGAASATPLDAAFLDGRGSSADKPAEPVFEAVIVPHQSLNRRGVLLLAAFVGVLSTVVALRFVFMGAWPVMAFSIAEVSLALLLLALNRRQALRREIIRLNEAEMTVVRTDAKGRHCSFSVPSAWLQVRLEPTGSGGGGSRLLVRSHGRGWEIGSFLHDPARQSLFEALKDALYRLRNRTFHDQTVPDC